MNNYSRSDFEIMAPVGSYESLQAAIHNGANSVYFGIASFFYCLIKPTIIKTNFFIPLNINAKMAYKMSIATHTAFFMK